MFSIGVLLVVCLVSAADFARTAEHYFPIVAAGFSPGSGDQFYVTELVIRNSGLAQANASVALFSPQGGSFEATLRTASASGVVSNQTADFFQMVIPPNGTWRGYLTETGDLQTGWAIISSDTAVNSVAIFSLNSRAAGLVSEAAVFESPVATVQQIFADTTARKAFITQLPSQTPSSDMGLAMANTSGDTVSVTIRLLDSGGSIFQSVTTSLAPLSSVSKFLREFFPGLSSFQGTVELRSRAPIAALGLRYTGTLFTTIPVTVTQ